MWEVIADLWSTVKGRWNTENLCSACMLFGQHVMCDFDNWTSACSDWANQYSGTRGCVWLWITKLLPVFSPALHSRFHCSEENESNMLIWVCTFITSGACSWGHALQCGTIIVYQWRWLIKVSGGEICSTTCKGFRAVWMMFPMLCLVWLWIDLSWVCGTCWVSL